MDRLFFQHPENGFPMVLIEDGHGDIRVEAGEPPSPGDRREPVAQGDAKAMTQALAKRGLFDIMDAGRFLRDHFYCSDIFD